MPLEIGPQPPCVNDSSDFDFCVQRLAADFRRQPCPHESMMLLVVACVVILLSGLLTGWRRQRAGAQMHKHPFWSGWIYRGACHAYSHAEPPESIGQKRLSDPLFQDPSLLKKHSRYRSYTIPFHGFTYPRLRVFYRPHSQAEKLPTKPSPLPLLVFIHGLGGSLAQFHPLLHSLVSAAPCLGIDLPGCGLSEFAPKTWGAYTTNALVELLSVVINHHRDRDADQGVVLIGHSMGCSLAVLLASSTSPHPGRLDEHSLGLLAICPKAGPPTNGELAWINKILYLPIPLFDLWRSWDRRGGVKSKSVQRIVGEHADLETRKLQMKFNKQSRTAVWRRMIGGIIPRQDSSGKPSGGLPGEDIWAGLNMPVFLVAGAGDKVTKPTEIYKIVDFLRRPPRSGAEEPSLTSTTSKPAELIDAGSLEAPRARNRKKYVTSDGIEISSHDEGLIPLDGRVTTYHIDRISRRVLKTTVLPPPAAHALLYTPGSSRILAGLISDFMATHISPRLSLGWQLQYLSTEGKWDVKNLAKWQAIQPVSEPIAGTFRAMKTLREVDGRHRPEIFVQEWRGRIKHVVDISHDNPVYDPRGLENGGIKYHKFPTVSKLPPSLEEVTDFISLIDGLIAEQAESEQEPVSHQRAIIGVHCHYGFNRTGFLIVSYLVERRGFALQGALDEFAKQRAPGIRHDHFVDTLFVRYCMGFRRKPSS